MVENKICGAQLSIIRKNTIMKSIDDLSENFIIEIKTNSFIVPPNKIIGIIPNDLNKLSDNNMKNLPLKLKYRS